MVVEGGGSPRMSLDHTAAASERRERAWWWRQRRAASCFSGFGVWAFWGLVGGGWMGGMCCHWWEGDSDLDGRTTLTVKALALARSSASALPT